VGCYIYVAHVKLTGTGEVFSELGEVGKVGLGDVGIDGVVPEGQIAGQHPRPLEAGVVEGQRVVGGGVEGLPLVSAAGALDERPLIVPQGLEEVIGPLVGRLAPGDLEARGEGAGARPPAASPAELLLADVSSLGCASELAAVEGSVCLACKG
jgi:hypothetical protein